MKKVAGSPIWNVEPYVFIIDRTPSNSTVAFPFSAALWNVGAAAGNAAVRSRLLPLRSCQSVSAEPSAAVSLDALNQIWSPAVTGGEDVAEPVIMPVAADDADVWPAPFVAVTTTRRRAPMSLAVTRYVALVAPARLTQLAPALSQRCHW